MSEPLRFTEQGTLYSERYGDIYFSDGHGLEETDYVFLKPNRLRERWSAGETVRVGETGFGTGLNFLAAWQAWRQQGGRGRYIHLSAELHPLSRKVTEQALRPFAQLAELSAQLAAALPGETATGRHSCVFEGGAVQLVLMIGDAAAVFEEAPLRVDAWFLDGFAPARNPQMWNERLYRALAACSMPGATLGTFTAAGEVRRGLAAAGFRVERSQGFGHKKHRVTAVYEGSGVRPPSTAICMDGGAYAVRPADLSGQASIAVIGAGVAGCAMAAELSSRGRPVVLYERHGAAASEASGNPLGLVMPLGGLPGNRLAEVSALAFAHTSVLLERLAPHAPQLQRRTGVLELAGTVAEAERFTRLALGGSARFCSPEELAARWDLGGDALHGGLWHESACTVAPAAFCRALLEQARISPEQACIKAMAPLEGGWELEMADGTRRRHAQVVLCCAYAAKELAPWAQWPLRRVRGQLALVPSPALRRIDLPALVFGHYLIPDAAGSVLGATFQEDDMDAAVRAADHEELWEALRERLPELCPALAVPPVAGRTAWRCATPDHLPLIGPVPDVDALVRWGLSERHGRQRLPGEWPALPWRSGLYASLGHGSRGLVSAPWAARLLADEMLEGFFSAPPHLRAHLHPGRFAVRECRRGRLGG